MSNKMFWMVAAGVGIYLVYRAQKAAGEAVEAAMARQTMHGYY